MEVQENCPICNKENSRIYSTECVGVVEDHYFCEQCGYFRHMAYSPVIEGVAIPEGMTPEEHNAKYGEIIAQKKLKMYHRSIFDYL